MILLRDLSLIANSPRNVSRSSHEVGSRDSAREKEYG